MRRLILVAVAMLTAGAAFSQVPSDYAPPAAAYPPGSMDAQIEAVRQNYERVRAEAQIRMAAEAAAKAEAERAAAQAKAAEAARVEAQRREAAAQQRAREKAAAAERDRRQAREERYEDQLRELELEMKRLELRSKQSDLRVKEAVDEQKIRRADEIVEKIIQNEAAPK